MALYRDEGTCLLRAGIFRRSIEKLSIEEKARLLDEIFYYGTFHEHRDLLDDTEGLGFIAPAIMDSLEQDWEHFQEVKKINSENASKRRSRSKDPED